MKAAFPPKRWYLSIKLHGVTSQETVTVIYSADSQFIIPYGH
jgi:hypothetical protein